MAEPAPAPLLAERLRIQQSCPFWRALGIDLLEWGGGRAVTRMTARPSVALAADGAVIDPLAIVGMLDDAFSNAIASVVPLARGMATLELAISFARMPERGGIIADTRVSWVDQHCAAAETAARDEEGRAIVTGRALFTLGGYPGGSLPDPDRIGGCERPAAPAPFARLLGFGSADGEPAMAGGNDHLIGWETGRALHGGVIGALLMEACLRRGGAAGRLAALAIRYLRPGRADSPLASASEIERSGRSASFVTAHCFHEAGRDVARATATFVPR